jgi:hypothetical protein
MTNIVTKPRAKSIGVVRWMRPRQSVAIHENTLIPVGIAMRSVVIIIGTRSQSAMPATNMWCAQTEKPSTRIPSSESAISR